MIKFSLSGEGGEQILYENYMKNIYNEQRYKRF